jgi:hypothetical protein
VFKQLANIDCHSCSQPLQRRIVDFCSERSGRASVTALVEHYSIEVPLYTVDAVTRNMAKQAYEFNLERPPGKTPAAVQVTELDGSMVPIVEFKEATEVSSAAEKADKRKRRTCQWNEIRVCSTHDTKLADARFGVSFGGVLETGLMMAATCAQSGMNPTTRIHGVGDGATWIAAQYEEQFGTQGSYLLDFYHVCEYLGEAAEGCPGGGTPAGKKRWMERQKKRLKENRYEEVIGELESNLEAQEVVEKEAPVRRCSRYLSNRRNQLDYNGAIEADLPIGSGEVESSHRHLLQQRLKIPGAWWKKETAADMAQLRVMRANKEWETFWQEKAA